MQQVSKTFSHRNLFFQENKGFLQTVSTAFDWLNLLSDIWKKTTVVLTFMCATIIKTNNNVEGKSTYIAKWGRADTMTLRGTEIQAAQVGSTKSDDKALRLHFPVQAL